MHSSFFIRRIDLNGASWPAQEDSEAALMPVLLQLPNSTMGYPQAYLATWKKVETIVGRHALGYSIRHVIA